MGGGLCPPSPLPLAGSRLRGQWQPRRKGRIPASPRGGKAPAVTRNTFTGLFVTIASVARRHQRDGAWRLCLKRTSDAFRKEARDAVTGNIRRPRCWRSCQRARETSRPQFHGNGGTWHSQAHSPFSEMLASSCPSHGATARERMPPF